MIRDELPLAIPLHVDVGPLAASNDVSALVPALLCLIKRDDGRIAYALTDTDAADIDLYTAVIAGLVNQQWANDPGGSRWGRLLERAIDMYADNIGLPREDS